MFYLDPTGSYWVLETDYENYSVVYSCVASIFVKTLPYKDDIQNRFLSSSEM